jgi:biofilm protein TabA
MFNTSTQYAEKYDYLEKKFKIGYEFLRRSDLESLEVGAIQLEEGVLAQVQQYTTNAPEEVMFETHDRNFDIQYVVSGEEMFGIADREFLEVEVPYNAQKDVSFYKEPAHSGAIYLKAGDFVVVSPEEGHKPHCNVSGPCEVKKIVIKVPVK